MKIPTSSAVWLMITSALLITGCGERNQVQPPPPPTVTVQTPVVKTVTEFAEYAGYTEAAKHVELHARVTGFLEKVHFKASEKVEKGQLLFTIEQTQYKAALDKAKADKVKAEAELELADATVKRMRRALENNAVSELEVLEAEAKLSVAKAAIEQANAGIIDAERNFSYTEVRAPLTGQINRNLIDEGNLVSPGVDGHLATIINNDPIYVYFNLSETELLKYMAEQEQRGGSDKKKRKKKLFLGLGNEGDFPFEGYFDYIDNRVDRSTGTVQLRGRFENPNNAIVDGLYARVRFSIQTIEDAIMIPDYAISNSQRGPFVMIVDENNIAQTRMVKLGVSEAGLVQITEGIKAGEKVITNGLLKARPGQPVAPQMQSAEKVN